MWVESASSHGTFTDLYERVGIVPFPGGVVGCSGSWTRGYFVSADAPHPEVAWRWIEFLTRHAPEPLYGGLAALKAVNEETAFWQKLDPESRAVYEYGLENSVCYPRSVGRALLGAYESALDGESLTPALEKAQASAAESLAREAASAELGGRTPMALVTTVPDSLRLRTTSAP